MATLVSPSFIDSHSQLRDMVFAILDDMIDKGNLVANDHKAEMKALEALLGQLQSPVNNVPPYPEGVEQQIPLSDRRIEMSGSMIMDETAKAAGVGLDGWHGEVGVMGNDSGQTDIWNSTHDMSPMQLMELVDMLNTDSLLDWATGLDQ